jgi:hypothetical protein
VAKRDISRITDSVNALAFLEVRSRWVELELVEVNPEVTASLPKNTHQNSLYKKKLAGSIPKRHFKTKKKLK